MFSLLSLSAYYAEHGLCVCPSQHGPTAANPLLHVGPACGVSFCRWPVVCCWLADHYFHDVEDRRSHAVIAKFHYTDTDTDPTRTKSAHVVGYELNSTTRTRTRTRTFLAAKLRWVRVRVRVVEFSYKAADCCCAARQPPRRQRRRPT